MNVYNLNGTPYQTPQDRATSCVKRVKAHHLPLSARYSADDLVTAAEMARLYGWSFRNSPYGVLAYSEDYDGAFDLKDAIELHRAIKRGDSVGVAKE